jgi:hypothetical protein
MIRFLNCGKTQRTLRNSRFPDCDVRCLCCKSTCRLSLLHFARTPRRRGCKPGVVQSFFEHLLFGNDLPNHRMAGFHNPIDRHAVTCVWFGAVDLPKENDLISLTRHKYAQNVTVGFRGAVVLRQLHCRRRSMVEFYSTISVPSTGVRVKLSCGSSSTVQLSNKHKGRRSLTVLLQQVHVNYRMIIQIVVSSA